MALSKKLALTLLSLLASLFLAELLARSFAPVRNVGPTFSVYDPIYGKRLKRNFSCTRYTPEFTMTFTTNSEGFRGPEWDVVPERPILFLGDSFTAGYGVNDGEEFPALVRAALADRFGENTFPVVNAAMGNIGNGYWIKFLRSEGSRFNPRYVVLQLCGNDFKDNISDGLFGLTSSGELTELPPPQQSRARRVQELIEAIPGLSYSYLVSLARQAFVDGRGVSRRPAQTEHAPAGHAPTGPNERLTYLIIQNVLELCESKAWPVVVLNIDIEGERLAAIEKILAKHHVPIIAVPGKAQRPDLYFRIDGHLNASGHSFVASSVVERLAAELERG